MTLPSPETVMAALEATWPPASTLGVGAFTLRDGAGGGKRVSAATPNGPETTVEDIENAAAVMAAAQCPRLFRLSPGHKVVDQMLTDLGYQIIDPTTLFIAPTANLLKPDQAPLAAIAAETCLGIQADIWEDGGIGPARRAVMARAASPKAWLLARVNDRAVGAGFVSVDQGIAMVHALDVRRHARRQGAGRAMMHRAAAWAQTHDAVHIGVAVTQANVAATTLYASLGMTVVEQYHYRIHSNDVDP